MKRVFLKLEEAILGPWFHCPFAQLRVITKDSSRAARLVSEL